VTARAAGASCLAMGPLAPQSRPPLEAREVQVSSMLGFSSRLGSSAGLRGREGEEEEKLGFSGSVAVLSKDVEGE